jgi:hypothetical protein
VTDELIGTIESAIKEGTSHLEKLHASGEYLAPQRPFTAAYRERQERRPE